MSQNNLSITLHQLDGAGETLARRLASFSDAAPTAGEYRAGVLADTSEATITLPVAQVRQVYIANTHASAKITVKWTPNGGSKVTILILAPGDMIAFWNETTGTTVGVSTVSLTSDTSSATYEMFLGG